TSHTHHFSPLRPLHPRSSLFPYTTLFRSRARRSIPHRYGNGCGRPAASSAPACRRCRGGSRCRAANPMQRHIERPAAPTRTLARSEEHTSELQSREKLVCRLLLEKKKKTI